MKRRLTPRLILWTTTAALAVACSHGRAVELPNPPARIPDAADSARAERIAGMIGRPVARYNGFYWEGQPPAAPERGSGGVLVAFIAHDGRVEPHTISVLQAQGPVEYTRNVCRALPGLRLRTIAGQPIETLVIMPLTHESDRIHADLLKASERIVATLAEMSVEDRRAWLLGSGCSRYQ